jgi:hypothetical protein
LTLDVSAGLHVRQAHTNVSTATPHTARSVKSLRQPYVFFLQFLIFSLLSSTSLCEKCFCMERFKSVASCRHADDNNASTAGRSAL